MLAVEETAKLRRKQSCARSRPSGQLKKGSRGLELAALEGLILIVGERGGVCEETEPVVHGAGLEAWRLEFVRTLRTPRAARPFSAVGKIINMAEKHKLPQGDGDTKRIKLEMPIDAVAVAPMDEDQAYAIKMFNEGKNLVITGPAGTGKSHVLRQVIRASPSKGRYVTAPTGAAALIVNGTTLHSFLGAGLATDSAESIYLRLGKDARSRLRETRILIVDEGSMVSDELFDKLDYVMRKVRGNDAPMGGAQLVMCGDFLQLSPVNGEFCFVSDAFAHCFPDRSQVINLKKIFRQSDGDMITTLNELRMGHVTENGLRTLEPCFGRKLQDAVKLFPRRVDVERVNTEHLNRLDGPTHVFKCTDTGVAPYVNQLKDCMAPDVLNLRVGAFVMLVRNRNSVLVNGSTGYVVGFKDDAYPIVKFLNGAEVTCTPEVFTIEVEGSPKAARKQVPLILAWACTIHKIQGATLDRVEVDLKGCFAPGQAYVALSRAKTLEGLSIENFDKSLVSAHKKALEWYRSLDA